MHNTSRLQCQYVYKINHGKLEHYFFGLYVHFHPLLRGVPIEQYFHAKLINGAVNTHPNQSSIAIAQWEHLILCNLKHHYDSKFSTMCTYAKGFTDC